MSKQRIGILGGIGPEATGAFYIKVIAELHRHGTIRSNADFPQIIVNSIPAPELIYDTVSDAELEPYITGVQELERFGADFIAMACNTIHFFLDELQRHIKAPIINLPLEMHTFLKQAGLDSVTVLGTPTTMRKGLYRFEGITYREVSDAETEGLSNAIFNFNRGAQRDLQIAFVEQLTRDCLRSSKVVILGCTELAVMMQGTQLPTIDPLDILAEAAAVRFVRGS